MNNIVLFVSTFVRRIFYIRSHPIVIRSLLRSTWLLTNTCGLHFIVVSFTFVYMCGVRHILPESTEGRGVRGEKVEGVSVGDK